MNFPKVLISIVNWMNYWDTIACISLCKEQLYKNIEIIVIDNASKNESVEKIKTAHPDVLLIRNKKNKGFAGGHRIAQQYALDNKIVALLLLNPDTKIFLNTIQKLVEAYNVYGDAIYGGIMVDKNHRYELGGGYNVCSDFSINKNINFNDLYINKPIIELKGQIINTSNVEGACFFIPLAITKKIGFLSEDYFMYSEELEYCYRANKNKFNVFLVCDSVYLHAAAQSFLINSKLKYLKIYYNTRNYILFATKYNLLSKKKIIKDNKGIFNIIKKLFFNKNSEEYYFFLAILHALMGIKGKMYFPEKYI